MRFRPVLKLLIVLLTLGCVSITQANPSGAQVINGTVTFSNPIPTTLNITNTPGAIINWQQFGINSGELTHFQQQSITSAVLNRVVGQNPSDILGSLTSNGRVFVVNPNGVYFGEGSVIDTAGLIASTLNISDQNFLNNHLKFEDLANASEILNKGFIHTSNAGEVVLVAPNVTNEGVIDVEYGTLLLAAGQSVTLSSMSLDNIEFAVQAPANKAINLGQLLSDGGSIGVFAGSITNSGTISANAITVDAAGNIQLVASGDNVNIDATITATSTTGKGGHIEILGDRVGLFGETNIDASGATGGGEVLVGGDFQGRGETQTATRTQVSSASSIHADATVNGDGGKVIVWADEYTEAHGIVTAKAGPRGGNGGFVEISGKSDLFFDGFVDASAANGIHGEVLFDPLDLTVALAGLDLISGNDILFSENVGTLLLTIDPSTITAITNLGIAVTLQASRTLTITDPIITNNTGGNGGALTLDAGEAVFINANITTDNALLRITANNPGASDNDRGGGAAVIQMTAGTTLDTGTANIELVLFDRNGFTNFANGDITLNNLSAADILITYNGQTAGGSVLRVDATSLITANSLFIDHEDIFGPGGGSVGTLAAPLRFMGNNISAHIHNTSTNGINIDSLQAVTIGQTCYGLGDGGINCGLGHGIQGLETILSGDISFLSTNGIIVDDDIFSGNTGQLTLNADSDTNGSGDLTILAGNSIDTFGNTLNITVGNNVNIIGGQLGGSGTVTGNVISTGGLIDIESTGVAGTLIINGFLTLDANSTLAFDLGGLTQGTQYDFLDVTGNVTLDGIAVMFWDNGFTSPNGSPFDLIRTGGAFTGAFTTVIAPTGVTAFTFDNVVTPTLMRLVTATVSPNIIFWTSLVNGDWNLPGNWGGGVVPVNGDFAVIQNDITVTISDVQTVSGLEIQDNLIFSSAGSLTINGDGIITSDILTLGSTGGLTANGNLTLASQADWTSGTLSGSGGITIHQIGGLNISGGGLHTINGVTINNNGITTAGMTASDLTLNMGAVFNNNKLFDFTTDLGIRTTSGGGTFNNNTGAEIRKSGGAGNSTISNITLNSIDATFNAQTGTIRLTGAANFSNMLTIDPTGSNLLFNSNTITFNDGSSVVGSINLASGTVSVPGTTMINNTLNWIGTSTITGSGTGTLVIAPGAGLNITGGGTYTFSNITVNNNGTTTAGMAAIDLTLNTGAIFNNNNLFNFTTDLGIRATTGVGTFNNNTGAEIRKSAGAVNSTISNITLNSSDATFNAQTGTIRLTGIANFSNVLTIDPTGSNLLFNSTTITFIDGSSVVGSINLASGIVNIPGTTTINNTLNWIGTSIISGSGIGTLVIAPGAGLNITGGGTYTFSNITVNNNGTTTAGMVAVDLTLNSGATFNNNGLFNFTTDLGIRTTSGGGTFNNNTGAEIRKSGGAGNSTISNITLNSSDATFNAQTGTIRLTGAANFSNVLTIDPTGSNLLFNSTTITFNDGSSVVGSINLGSGTVNVPGTTTINNTLNWIGTSTISGSGTGTLVIAPGAGLNITGGGTYTFNNITVNNNGTTTAGMVAVDLTLNTGATFNNNNLFNFTTNLGIRTTSGGGTFNNNTGAEIRKSAGVGFSTITSLVGFTNTDATINILSGSLAVQGAVLALDIGSVLTGTGTYSGDVTNNGGTIKPGGAGIVGTLTIMGNYIQTTGNIEIDVTATGTAGTNYDLLSIGGTASLADTVTLLNVGYTPLDNDSFTPIVSTGLLSGAFTTVINIPGTIAADSYPANQVDFLLTLGNLINWTGLFDNVTWNNAGNWDLGIPNLTDDVVIVGTFNIAITGGANVNLLTLDANSTVTLNSGTFTLGASSTLDGLLNLSAGSLNIAGTTLTLNGGINWSDGTITGAGSMNVNGDMFITGATTKTVDGITITTAANVTMTGNGNLDLVNGGIFQNLGALSFNSAGNGDIVSGDGTGIFDNVGRFINSAGNTIISTQFIDSTVTGSLVEVTGGTLTIFDPVLQTDTAAYTISNGTLQLSTDRDLTGLFTMNGGTLRIDSGANVNINPGGNWNVTNLVLTDPGTSLSTTGNIALAGTFNWQDGTLNVNQFTLGNGSVMNVSALSATLNTSSTVNQGGIITVFNGAALDQGIANYSQVSPNASVVIQNSALFDAGVVALGTAPTANNGGQLVVDGTILADINNFAGNVSGTGAISGNLNNDGILSPGVASTAEMIINGDLTLGATSSYVMEMNGTSAGQFDSLVVNGNITFDGEMELVLGPNYNGTENDMFIPFTASGVKSGNFAALRLPPTGFDFNFDPVSGGLVLTVVGVKPGSVTPTSPTNDVINLINTSEVFNNEVVEALIDRIEPIESANDDDFEDDKLTRTMVCG